MLKEGDNAPNFKGLDQNEKSIQLSDFSAKKLVLYFYPKDDTPGCTKESCNLRDNYTSLIKDGYARARRPCCRTKNNETMEYKNILCELLCNSRHELVLNSLKVLDLTTREIMSFIPNNRLFNSFSKFI
jgi:peroxiredoxin